MPTYSKETFNSSNMGIVFFDIKQPGSFKKNVSLDYFLKSINNQNEYKINISTTQTLPGLLGLSKSERNYIDDMLLLEPGIYYINYIQLLSSHNGYASIISWLPRPGIKNNLISYGAFEVKAGEVLSLGHLLIEENEDIEFNSITDIENVKAELIKSDRPELADLLKQGHFYNRGSILIQTKDDKFKIIDSKIIDLYRSAIADSIQQAYN